MNITTLGIGLAKSAFMLHGVDAGGAAVLEKRLRRGAAVLTYFIREVAVLMATLSSRCSHQRMQQNAASPFAHNCDHLAWPDTALRQHS